MKSLELFSGAGGLAAGLQNAGFEHTFFVENNKDACASLCANFNPDKVFFGDVRDFDLNNLPDIDLVAGGPPCQPFSLGGKHQADQDHRDMFPHAIAAIAKLAPKAFIFENVKGLLRPSFSEYFEYILLRLTYPGFKIKHNQTWQEHLHLLQQLPKLSYTGTRYIVHWKLINAADFGIPQTRERVILIGLRTDVNATWTWPTATHSQTRLLWDLFVSGDYGTRHHLPNGLLTLPKKALPEKIRQAKQNYLRAASPSLPWQTVRDALADIPDPRQSHQWQDHLFRDGARSYPGHTGSEIDWPAKTIKAGGHGVPGGENMLRFDDNTIRYFTVFEAKRLQTFADDFMIKGAWGEAMRQIGNAVPVRLAQILGQQLALILNKNMSSQKRVANQS